MRNWSELVKPDQIMREEEAASVTHGKFICERWNGNYGTTIGNAMRAGFFVVPSGCGLRIGENHRCAA